MSDNLAKEKAAREAEERRRAGGPLEAKKPARNLSAGGLSGRGEVYGRTANREPVLDARTQAWVDEKQGKPSGPLPLDVVESGAEAIRAASGFTNPKGGSSNLLGGGASETVSNAFKPGDMRYEKPDGSGEVVSRNGADSDARGQPEPAARARVRSSKVVEIKPPGLADKFIVPPFSVLDTRAGYWQERRRAWLSMGMRGETRAEEKALNTTAGQHQVERLGCGGSPRVRSAGRSVGAGGDVNDRALGASGRRTGHGLPARRARLQPRVLHAQTSRRSRDRTRTYHPPSSRRITMTGRRRSGRERKHQDRHQRLRPRPLRGGVQVVLRARRADNRPVRRRLRTRRHRRRTRPPVWGHRSSGPSR